MNSRERLLTALAHQEPDRVPIDLGGTVVSTIAIPTYAALRKHLGLPEKPVETLDNPPDGYRPVFVEEPDGARSFKDEFGATLRRPKGCHYYDWRGFPLPDPSLDALRAMPWPDAANPGRYRGLRARVMALRASTDRALFGMAPCGHDLFNQLFRVRGMENGLMDLLADPDCRRRSRGPVRPACRPGALAAAGQALPGADPLHDPGAYAGPDLLSYVWGCNGVPG